MTHNSFASLSRSCAGLAALLALGSAVLCSPVLCSAVLADIRARNLKPALPVAAEAGDTGAQAHNRTGANAMAVAQGGHVVSFATRDFDVGKLDADAFGDGEDVKR